MKTSIKTTLVFSIIAIACIYPKHSYAWGAKGHALIAQIAMHFVKPDVQQNVLKVLGTMSVDTAANWMDIMRSNPDYDYMKPWHYIDFPKGQDYQPSTKENIVNRILITYNELKHKKTLSIEQIKTDVLVLLHLLGDIHQPLHTGYDEDLGGNKISIQFGKLKTNLHHFWDDDIIDKAGITMEDCLQQQSEDGVIVITPIEPPAWVKDNRTLLDSVYDYSDFTLDQAYLNRSARIVKRQLLIAGMRLAAMLNETFYSPAPNVDLKALAVKYENGIEAKDALQYVGKQVTVCS